MISPEDLKPGETRRNEDVSDDEIRRYFEEEIEFVKRSDSYPRRLLLRINTIFEHAILPIGRGNARIEIISAQDLVLAVLNENGFDESKGIRLKARDYFADDPVIDERILYPSGIDPTIAYMRHIERDRATGRVDILRWWVIDRTRDTLLDEELTKAGYPR